LANCTFNTYLSILRGECAQKPRVERGPNSALEVLLNAATKVAGLLENNTLNQGAHLLSQFVQCTDFIEQILQDPNFALDVLPDAVTNSAGNHGIECYTYEAIIASQVVVKRKGCLPPYCVFKVFSHREQAIILQALQVRCDSLMGEERYLLASSNSASNSFTSAPPIPNLEGNQGKC
jgi:hypothetical protein